jgi:8-oxo-dGTP pyrophosphatase MutT (NUDIX family)
VDGTAHRGVEAAVLVPLFSHGDEVYVWFLRRPASMRSHPGQIAFPGGRKDAADASLQHTALREAEEEVGLPPHTVDVLGQLDALPTVTGYVVTPFLGWIKEPVALAPNPTEVARVFSAPLATFLDEPREPALGRLGMGYRAAGELIWGATAAMIRDVGACLRVLMHRPTP